MTDFDQYNPIYKLALSFINNTDKHLFLTGKAGTGKTTFLRQIRQNTYKKSVIVAPTGVAAINAEGMTIHALFNLPLKPFLPTEKASFEAITFNSTKRLLLSELELLVIDEVSMLRADTLDAVDSILQKLRGQKHGPFGGVQVVYIGDLMQLSPIVKTPDWNLLKQHYQSEFFIDSFAFQTAQPACLTLEKIYRQKDESFIKLLNRIRIGQNDEKTLSELNQFYSPQGNQKQDDSIVLTTHNQRVEEINASKLNALSGELHCFYADITGNFLKSGYPTDSALMLKEGAQIMMVKNDKGLQKRYYNGKIGIIEKIEKDLLHIRFSSGELLPVEKEIWKQIDYRYQQEVDDISEEELGSFYQFPVRLAWAITIHKSQGLTFDSAVIDAADSFLPGQVYVALSRLSSKEYLRLCSLIPAKAIRAHSRIIDFSKKFLSFQEVEQLLDKAKYTFFGNEIVKRFSFKKLESAVLVLQKQFSDDTFILSLQNKALELDKYSQTFSEEMLDVFKNSDSSNTAFLMRIERAIHYFSDQIDQFIINPLHAEIEKLKTFTLQKKLNQSLHNLLSLANQKRKDLLLAQSLINAWKSNQEIALELFTERKRYREKLAKEHNKKITFSNEKNYQDYKISLQMFQDGKTVNQIAKARNLNVDTIEYQLSNFLPVGELKIEQLINGLLLEKIISVLDANPDLSLSVLKTKLPDCSFGQLYAAQIYRRLKH